LCVTVEDQAGLGRNDAVIAAEKQLVLEVAFEGRDLLRQRGLCRAQEARGARHAAGVDHLDEALQLPEIDAHLCRTLVLDRAGRTRSAVHENTIWIGTILYLAH